MPTVIDAFHRQYPDIHCHFELGNQQVDPISSTCDVALRFGQQPSSSLIAHVISAMTPRLNRNRSTYGVRGCENRRQQQQVSNSMSARRRSQIEKSISQIGLDQRFILRKMWPQNMVEFYLAEFFGRIGPKQPARSTVSANFPCCKILDRLHAAHARPGAVRAVPRGIGPSRRVLRAGIPPWGSD